MDTSNVSPDLNQDLGFVKKKFALKKLVRDINGKTKIIFVDSDTNKQIADPKGYTVIESDNVPQDVQKTETGADITKEPTNKSTVTDQVLDVNKGGDRNTNIQSALKPTSNSYINKPAALSFASLLPGPLGLIGTVANVGINANNTNEVNKQKEVLGFSKPSAVQNLGSTVMDKKGYIGDQAVTDGVGRTRSTPVGFESQDSIGRTTLTPNEARMRNELDPTAQEATVAQKQNAQNAYKQAHPQGFLSNLQTAAKSIFSNLFGTQNQQTTKGQFDGVDTNSFPDAPTAPKNTTVTTGPSGNPTGVDTSGFKPGLW